MNSYPSLILIAGTARNVGKTTIACSIIKRVSAYKKVIGLKLTSIREDEEYHHACHDMPKTFSILEETQFNSHKDTSRMKRAGAVSSYWIVSREKYLEQAVNRFLSMIEDNVCLLAESAILHQYIQPNLFIIIDRKDALHKKDYIIDLRPLANIWIDDLLLLDRILLEDKVDLTCLKS